MKKVLVTGATGFIGRNCLPPLVQRGYQVHATVARTKSEGCGDIHWHALNLMDPAEVSDLLATIQPTHLLHFAWTTTPGEYWTSPENLRWVSASLHLLQEFARNGGQRIVMAGTCAEYDWGDGNCSESNTPLRPATLYGTCKAALGAMLEAFALQVGLSFGWGRIFFVYGPNEHPNRLVASVIRLLLAGKTARCSAATQARDFLHVQDVADAFVALLESTFSGAVNIASGKPVPIREVVCLIADKIGRPDLLALGALPMREDEPPLLVGDNRRLTDHVGWKPKYELGTGLEHTIGWWDNFLRRAENVGL